MTDTSPPPRDVADVYAEPGMHLWLRLSGPHLHGGSEDATVALATRAEAYGLRGGGRILEIASALGAPARYLARRFQATVICIDGDPRMHAAARAVNEHEGLGMRCLLLLSRTEHLPLADACCDAAWSQDALCHMDKPAVLREAARVLRPGALFAFTDFIARVPLTAEEQAMLAQMWAFPSLLRLPEYVRLLDESGFDVLLAEDRTPATPPRTVVRPPDQEAWDRDFTARYGEDEVARQYARLAAWQGLLGNGRGGYGMFIARRRDQTSRSV
jgi:SAM-dependent methyltransferase